MPENITFVELLKDIARSSTLHGLPKIVNCRQRSVRVMWCLFLLCTMALFFVQMKNVFDDFFSNPVQTKISIKYANLEFPAVTICNMNPIRKSKLKSLNTTEAKELHDLIYHLQNNSSASGNGTTPNNNDAFSDMDSLYDYLYGDSGDSIDNSEFFDNRYNVSMSKPLRWRDAVLTKFKKMSLETRSILGHQLDDFVHRMSYDGYSMDKKEWFFYHLNTYYGNCFTVQDLPVVRGSGSYHGLSLVLNLQINEYIEQLASGYGVRLIIHEKNAFPLPEREGHTLNSGFETNFAMKLRKINRLGGVYSECKEDVMLDNCSWPIKYTVPYCYASCESKMTLETCGCLPIDAPDTTEILEDLSIHNICDEKSFQCIKSVSKRINDGVKECQCISRCDDNSYTTTVAGRSWPFQVFLEKVLLKEICKTNNSSFSQVCNELQSNNSLSYEMYQKTAQNFARVNIYFEDLRYKEITEEPLYNWFTFYANVGGTMGLFMGASALTFLELVQLLVEALYFLYHKLFHKLSAVNPNKWQCTPINMKPMSNPEQNTPNKNDDDQLPQYRRIFFTKQ